MQGTRMEHSSPNSTKDNVIQTSHGFWVRVLRWWEGISKDLQGFVTENTLHRCLSLVISKLTSQEIIKGDLMWVFLHIAIYHWLQHTHVQMDTIPWATWLSLILKTDAEDAVLHATPTDMAENMSICWIVCTIRTLMRGGGCPASKHILSRQCCHLHVWVASHSFSPQTDLQVHWCTLRYS